MSAETFTTCCLEQTGKVSDKWSLYLAEYERLLRPLRQRKLRLLEIGTQNGGSLEIWSRYFPGAEKILGCDIDTRCGHLHYDDPRIALVTGDADLDEVENRILQQASSFDLIIDDGSHRSGDIIASFLRYFRHLEDGGLYVIEDLHCSYWQDYDGGLYHPRSSIAFFKNLVDVANHEHWGVDLSRRELLQEFAHYGGPDMEETLERVHSLEFINSLCVIRKAAPADNALGSRVVSGAQESVMPGLTALHGHFSAAPEQDLNPWSIPVDSMHLQLLERAAECDRLRDETVEQLRKIAMSGKTLAERDAELSSLKKEMEQQAEQAEKRIAALHGELAARGEELSALKGELAERGRQIAVLHASSCWRMTRPLRAIVTAARYARLLGPAVRRGGGMAIACRKALSLYRTEGPGGLRRRFEMLGAAQTAVKQSPSEVSWPQVTRPAQELFAPRPLIVAELSIPQCSKYRVEQKSEMLESLGVNPTILDWHDTPGCLNALQTHSLVIFYRVPAYDSAQEIIREAGRLRLPTIWEVDDLIFDREILAKSRTVAALDRNIYAQLLEGADLYRTAMLLCDRGIASTPGLADAMKEAGLTDVQVIENALDRQSLEIANKVLRDKKESRDGIVRIVYGSGTNTHNIDFQEAAPAILRILEKFANVRFRLIGRLDLPEVFARYESRIERVPFCSYEEYLTNLAECDVSISPLENYIFNESKSNIKFLEASIVKVPSVCSPRSAFTQVISHGDNGYLCGSDAEWETALTLLITDRGKRKQIGEAAYASVIRRYSPEYIAERQVAPMLERYSMRSETLRVLSVNCLYDPRSFGGATIVAEEVNKRINSYPGYQVHVFTTLPASLTPPYTVKRYESDGVNVYGVGLPDMIDARAQFENARIAESFAGVVDAVQPQVVHFHSIQGIGVSVIDLCRERGIPYVVTLHDTWWLCGRHFMVNRKGNFCGQEKIDPDLCAACVEDDHLNRYRSELLKTALLNASLLLAPSQYFADFYRKNGFGRNLLVNRNGITRPENSERDRAGRYVRFGYVGGNTEIKGFHLVRKVFSDLPAGKVQLILVDNVLNLGYTSFYPQDIEDIPDVKIRPAYTQETIDDFYAEIDVLLFPTRCKESFGLTVREALARGVWVISTDAGGVVEDIEEKKNGLIIPFDDDGTGLKKAVLATISRFSRGESPPEPTQLPPIVFFDQQAAELADLLEQAAADGNAYCKCRRPRRSCAGVSDSETELRQEDYGRLMGGGR